MTPQVVGAGFGGTGTNTLKLALEQLGFGPCHHMLEVRGHPEQLAFWQVAARGEPLDWDEVLAGCAGRRARRALLARVSGATGGPGRGGGENTVSMIDQEAVQRIARRIFEANRRRERFRPLRGGDAPGSMEAAYRIQDEVHRLFEAEGGFGPLGGHKIALTSRAVQELCGVDRPAYGAIFAATIRRSPVVLKAADFMHLGLEFELAVAIGSDVPASGAPYDRATIAPFVQTCMPAFELIEDRDADYGDLDAESILTDRCWCAGVVLGAPVEGWRHLDLATAPVELLWNGQAVDRGVAGDSMGHPLEGLAWIANHLADRGRAMAKGEIVITGSALKTRFPEPGDAITYTIAGLGETTARLEA